MVTSIKKQNSEITEAPKGQLEWAPTCHDPPYHPFNPKKEVVVVQSAANFSHSNIAFKRSQLFGCSLQWHLSFFLSVILIWIEAKKLYLLAIS